MVWCCREVLLMSDALAKPFGHCPSDGVLSQVLYHSSRGHWTFHAHLSAIGKKSEWSKAHELDLESAREVWKAFFKAWGPWFRNAIHITSLSTSGRHLGILKLQGEAAPKENLVEARCRFAHDLLVNVSVAGVIAVCSG